MSRTPNRPRNVNPASLEYGTVRMDTKTGQIDICGPHGRSIKANIKQPSEVGLAVIEAMAGSKVGSLGSYRKEEK